MISLGPISGLSAGWLLAGVGAAALPVAAHLLRRRSRRIMFPPAAILARQNARARRGRRLHDRLLLALRVLIVLLAALAFDRPTWSSNGDGSVDRGVGRDVVLLLDQSASMSVVESGRSRFDRAVAKANELLRSLDADRDRAAVVFVRRSSRAALPEMSSNFDALRQRAHAASVTLERGDAAGALALAQSLLPVGDAATRARSIIVLSDGQRTQWAEALESFDFSGVAVRVEDVARESDLANLSIEGFIWPDEGLRPGATARLGVRVFWTGEADRVIDIALRTVHGVQHSTVTAPAGGRAVAWFDVQTPGASASWMPLRATIGADAFPADDALEAMAPLETQVSVGVLGLDEDADSAALNAMKRALEAAGARVSALHGGGAEDLGAVDLVLVSGALGAAELAREDSTVHAFLENGGRVLLVLDSDAAVTAASNLGWLEFDGGEQFSRADDGRLSIDSVLNWLGASVDQTSAFAALVDQISIAHFAGVRAAGDAQESVQFADGSFLFLIKRDGSGRIAILNAAVNPRLSGLGASPLFPLLMDGTVRRLVDEMTVTRVHIGERIAGADESLQMTDGAAALRDDGWYAENPGAIWWSGDDGARHSAVLGIDAQESDLRSAPFHGGSSASSGFSETLATNQALALWPWLIAAALALALIEQGLSSGASRSHTRAGSAAA